MDKKKFNVIGTKISPHAFEQINAIASRAHVSVYSLLQVVIDCYIKVFCCSEPISDYMREVLYKFTDFDRAKKGFSFVSHTLRNLSMSKCLAIVSAPKKEIPEIVLLEKEGENITENRNSDQILTEFLQAFSPKVLRGLQTIMRKEKAHNLADALIYAVNEAIAPEETLHDEINALFLDNERAENGKCATDYRGYKSTRNNYKEYASESGRKSTDFDPSQIYDPLQDFVPDPVPEFAPDPEPEFVPDFAPSQIYDPLQDYEPEFVPDYEPEYI